MTLSSLSCLACTTGGYFAGIFFFPNQCFLIIGSGVCSYFPLASGGGRGIKGGKSENHAHLKVILKCLGVKWRQGVIVFCSQLWNVKHTHIGREGECFPKIAREFRSP